MLFMSVTVSFKIVTTITIIRHEGNLEKGRVKAITKKLFSSARISVAHFKK